MPADKDNAIKRTQILGVAYRTPNANAPELNRSYIITQSDVFESGLVRQIGAHAFTVWPAIKTHADYATGECWPGMRRLAEITGLSTSTVQAAVKTLVDAKMLRIISGGSGTRSNRYVARERLDVLLGGRKLCTIVVDYIPSRLFTQLQEIEKALQSPPGNAETFVSCEILPGDGFTWDPETCALKAAIPAPDIMTAPFTKRLEALRKAAPKPVDK
jgi:hypothetical protein